MQKWYKLEVKQKNISFFLFFQKFQIHFRIAYNLCSANNEQHTAEKC